MRLAVFDLDNTLLAGDSDHLWGQWLVQNGAVDPQYYARENDRFFREYQDGTLNIHEYAGFMLPPIVENGLEPMLQLRRRFIAECIQTIVARGSRDLLAQHRAAGDVLLITTATNRFVVEPIAQLLGVEHLIATDPEIVDGQYTGRIEGTANFQHGKVERMKTWLTENASDGGGLTCYSDSHNDVPLLEMGDTAVAVDPDPRLRAVAEQRGWRVISLR